MKGRKNCVLKTCLVHKNSPNSLIKWRSVPHGIGFQFNNFQTVSEAASLTTITTTTRAYYTQQSAVLVLLPKKIVLSF